jgi:hypothetical protein
VGVFLALTALGAVVQAMQEQPEWLEELIQTHRTAEGAVALAPHVYSSAHLSRAETHEYLERLGLGHLDLDSGALLDPEVRIFGSDAFHGVLEAKVDWAAYRLELNGKFAVRQFTEVLGQGMTVTTVISSDGLLISDDRGGSRTEAYRRFPLDACDWPRVEGELYHHEVRIRSDGCAAPALFNATFDEASDGHGTIVEVVRNSQGLPIGVLFGENLLLRYKFTPPLSVPPGTGRVGNRWREPSAWDLIDVRTLEVVIDSVDAARVASGRPVLSVVLRGFSEVLRFEGGKAFAVARARSRPYALLPLETTSEVVWRIVHASAGRNRNQLFRVDYTDDLVRVRIRTREGDGSIVVQAPRSRRSLAPISFVHPGTKMLTDVLRSGGRLRTGEPLNAWLDDAFEEEGLPIVLTPFHFEGLVPQAVRFGLIEVEAIAEPDVVRAAASAEPPLQFGPAEGCEVEADRVLCTGGASDVIGEESSDPW